MLTMPPTTERWGDCEPNFRTFDGWPEADWEQVAADDYDALHENARAYLDYVSAELDTPIYAVGIGPNRSQTIVLERPFEN